MHRSEEKLIWFPRMLILGMVVAFAGYNLRVSPVKYDFTVSVLAFVAFCLLGITITVLKSRPSEPPATPTAKTPAAKIIVTPVLATASKPVAEPKLSEYETAKARIEADKLIPRPDPHLLPPEPPAVPKVRIAPDVELPSHLLVDYSPPPPTAREAEEIIVLTLDLPKISDIVPTSPTAPAIVVTDDQDDQGETGDFKLDASLLTVQDTATNSERITPGYALRAITFFPASTALALDETERARCARVCQRFATAPTVVVHEVANMLIIRVRNALDSRNWSEYETLRHSIHAEAFQKGGTLADLA